MKTVDQRSQVRDYLERVTRHPNLRDDQDIFEGGIVNSIFAVELVDFIETQFSVTVENDDLDLANFASIDAISTFVARKTEAA
jgi:acyl carrier protein